MSIIVATGNKIMVIPKVKRITFGKKIFQILRK